MRHTNNTYLTGRIVSARAYDGKNFGFMNLIMGDQIPIAVKLGGPKYNGQRLMAMEANIKSVAAMYAIIGGGYIQEKKNGGWEVSVNDSDFMTYEYPVPEYTFIHLRAKVLSITPDSSGTHWAEMSQSYFSKNPKDKEDNGTFKDRKVRVKLDRPWGQNVINQKMGITGSLCGMSGEQRVLHVVASLSFIFE